MSDELKPCPFCKNRSNIKLVEYRPNCSGAVVCGQCGARGPKKKNDHERGWKAKAIEAWNTRAERTCRMNHVLLYDEEAVDGIECDEYFYTEVHSLDDPLPERCPGCKAKVVG